MKRSRSPIIVTFFVLAFLYIPIILLIINSFNASRFGSAWTGFTFKWYNLLFEQEDMFKALYNSLVVATASTVISTVIGSLAAWALHSYRTRLQMTHYALTYLPLVIPDILMGISLLVLFASIGVSLSLFTVFLSHTTFCLSYITMVVLTRLQYFDYSIIEAAEDLGATRSQIIIKVLIPILAPGIMSGALLAFTISLDDFIITTFTAGPGATTLPLYVYSMIKYGSPPLINALSTLLLFATFILITLTQRLAKEDYV